MPLPPSLAFRRRCSYRSTRRLMPLTLDPRRAGRAGGAGLALIAARRAARQEQEQGYKCQSTQPWGPSASVLNTIVQNAHRYHPLASNL